MHNTSRRKKISVKTCRHVPRKKATKPVQNHRKRVVVKPVGRPKSVGSGITSSNSPRPIVQETTLPTKPVVESHLKSHADFSVAIPKLKLEKCEDTPPVNKLVAMKKLAKQIPKCIASTATSQNREQCPNHLYKICLQMFLSGKYIPVLWKDASRVIENETDIDLMESDRFVHLLDMDPHLGMNHEMEQIRGSTCTTSLVRQTMLTDTLTFGLWKSGLEFMPKLLQAALCGIGVVFEGSTSRLECGFSGLCEREQLCKFLVLGRLNARGPTIFCGLAHHMLFECIKDILFDVIEWIDKNNHFGFLAPLRSSLLKLVTKYNVERGLPDKSATKHLQFPNTAVTLLTAKRSRFYPGPVRPIDLLRKKICPELLTQEKIGVHLFSKFHQPSANLAQFCQEALIELHVFLEKCENDNLVSLIMSKSGKWILEIPSNLYILAKIDNTDIPGLVAVEYSEYGSNTKLYSYSSIGHLTVDKNLNPRGIDHIQEDWVPYRWFSRMFLYSKFVHQQ